MKPALFLFIAAASAHGAIVTLNPIQDAFVSAANPNSNFGGGGALSIASASLPNGEFDSLIKFDLASVKTSFDTTFGAGLWAIDSITLRLTSSAPNHPMFNGTGAGPGGTNVNFAGQFSIKWMLNDSWLEGSGVPNAPSPTGIMFSTLPNFLSASDEALGTFSFNGATSGNNTWNLALTSSFVADASAGNLVSFLALPADNAVGYLHNSANNAQVNNRPVLTISANAIPEPGSVALLACASAALAAQRRRNAHTA